MKLSIEDKDNDCSVTVERSQRDMTLWTILNGLVIPALNGMGYTTEEIDEELETYVNGKEKPLLGVKNGT